MTAADLLALAERVEQATGPSRELDAEIALRLVGRWEQADRHEHGGLIWAERGTEVLFCDPQIAWHNSWVKVPAFTASLDTVLTLYDEPPTLIHSNVRWALRDALRARAEVQS